MGKRGVDFLFVYAEAGFSLSYFGELLPPLGIVQIASFLNSNGFNCRVIDARHPSFTLEWFADYLSSMRPKFIGFSIFTDTIFTVARLVAIARRYSPSSKIVAGGPHATICDGDIIKDLEVDIAIRGEGEIPCLELLTKKKAAEISGATLKRGKKIIRNPMPPLMDLDILPPPDVDIIEGREQLKYLPSIVTGRGCPYRCAFCAAGILCPKIHLRSIDKVIEDISFLRRKTGARYILILDDTFTVGPKRIEEFCEKVAKIGGGKDFLWYAEGRADQLGKNLHLLRKMREAGLIFLQLGVESADEKVLSAYNKQITLDDVVSIYKTCARDGIFAHAGFIVGGAFESPATMEKTRQFAKQLVKVSDGYLQFMFAYLNPLPGTDIYLHPEKYGIRNTDPLLLSSVSFDNCVTETDSISREEIIRKKMEIMFEIMTDVAEDLKRKDDEFVKYCRAVAKITGPAHGSLFFTLTKTDDVIRLVRDQFNKLKEKFSPNYYPQFSIKSEGRWGDLIHSRMPLIDVDKNGNYISVATSGEPLTPDESKVFHYCSGKLTGKEIARHLSKKFVDLKKTFLSLEKKGCIVYRQY